jgi:hypothetical protein
MRARYLKIALILTLVLTVAGGQAQAWSIHKHGHGIEGSGDLETRELELDEFSRIDLGGAFDLEVSFGDRQKVEVTIDDNLWDNLDADVSGGELELDWKKDCQPDRHCKIKLTVRSLEEVNIHGACDAEIEGFKGDRFAYTLSGAGDLTMDGEVDELEIQVSGAGNADTRDLKAKQVKINVSGAGNATVYASEKIRARVSGVGQVTYYGDPEEENTSVSGIGSIKRK